MTQSDIALLARKNLICYSIAQWSGYKPADHHRLIADALERVVKGSCKRLMIQMPPRHGKSMLASEFFPSYYLGHHPDHQIIHATYAQTLADDFGRKVRNLMREPLFTSVFPNITLAEDSQASARFHTNKKGVYHGVGIEGGATGKGADLLLIDDPVKDREAAESETMREKIKSWYKSVAYTRLMPNAAIVIIQCMTGDTPVLMHDGTERALRYVRPGDRVATYLAGKISSSRVVNWASQGADRLFTIKMKSGRIVRANARHPFLVSQNGREEWRRTDTLKKGEKILTVTGESGKGSSAQPTVATKKLSAKVFARHITTRNVGLTVLDRLQSMLIHGVKRTLNTAMDFRWATTSGCWLHKAACVPFASNRLQTQTRERTGMASSALTTATTASESEGCFATIATLPLATVKPLKFCGQPLHTLSVTTDEIESVVEGGFEEVFDIQVENTENFIANGLVSHNTRWHEDDLSGWVEEEHKHEDWEILRLPAINDNDEALWPEAYPLERLLVIERTIGPRDFQSLYQQNPRPVDGAVFKRQWLQYYGNLNATGMNRLILVDPASGKRKNNDYTTMWVIGLGQDGNRYVLDVIRDRLNLTERAAALFRLHRKWRPGEVRYERYGLQADIEHIKSRMDDLNYRFAIIEVAGKVSKEDRIKRLVPLFQNGRIWMPHQLMYTDTKGEVHDLIHVFVETEFLSFPVGRHDDMIDGLARMEEPDLELPWPMQVEPDDIMPVVSYGVLDPEMGI